MTPIVTMVMINKMITAIFVPHTNHAPKKQVKVDLRPNDLQIRISDQEVIEISYSEAHWQIGGNRNSLLFLNASKLHEGSLYFEINPSLVNELQNQAQLSKLANQIRNQNHKGLTFTLAIIGGLVATIAILVIWRGPIFGSIGATIPFVWEQKIAAEVFKPKLTSEQMELVNELSQMFQQNLKEEKWEDKFTIHISSATEPNAFASIGGHIFINKGLLTELTSTEQLLGVVAHEMEHVKHRHVVRSLAQAAGLFSLFQIVIGDISGIVAILIDQGGPLLNLQYSRELEEQADDSAIDLLAKSGIDPQGLADALEKIQAQQKKMMAQATGRDVLEKLRKIEILSSHPEPEKRIHQIREKAQLRVAGKEIKKVKFDFEKFKTKVKDRF